jgi:hypothetical protein
MPLRISKSHLKIAPGGYPERVIGTLEIRVKQKHIRYCPLLGDCSKSLVPFITHLGSGLGKSITDISKLCPRSTLLDVLPSGEKMQKLHNKELSGWLQKIKLTK